MTYYEENRRYWTSGMEKVYKAAKRIIADKNGYKMTRGGLLGSLYTEFLISSDRNLESVSFTDVMAVITTLSLDDEIAVGDTLVPDNVE